MISTTTAAINDPTIDSDTINAIIVCVDFSDILSLTLPYNRHHFDRVVVVTAPNDVATISVATNNNCGVYTTESFYDNGAYFNKYKALEEGLDYLGRYGWICILDADIAFPKSTYTTDIVGMPLDYRTISLRRGCLYTPLRRMMLDLSSLSTSGIPKEDTWRQLPLHPQQSEWAGYTQIFHATDPVLGSPPWHDITWKHCGGGDSFFQAKWDKIVDSSGSRKLRPPLEVLHLGPSGENWLGRTTPLLDGKVLDGSRKRRLELQLLIAKRRGLVGDDRYRHEKL